VFAWYYEKTPSINPSIVVHEIKMYPNSKLVRQCLHLVHLKKVVAIKEEVEYILQDGFIYHVPLTDWVSNIFLVMKKHGTI